jgi:hypothetical protein
MVTPGIQGLEYIVPAEMHERGHGMHGADNTLDGRDCRIGIVQVHTSHDRHPGYHFAIRDHMQKWKLLKASV